MDGMTFLSAYNTIYIRKIRPLTHNNHEVKISVQVTFMLMQFYREFPGDIDVA